MMICLAKGYQEDTSQLQRHRVYGLVLDPTSEDSAIDWGWVDKDQYTANGGGGYELAINHNETLVSFPQYNLHGTSNPAYEATPREDGLFNLQLPSTPQRVAILYS